MYFMPHGEQIWVRFANARMKWEHLVRATNAKSTHITQAIRKLTQTYQKQDAEQNAGHKLGHGPEESGKA